MPEKRLAKFTFTGEEELPELQRGIQAAKLEQYEEARRMIVGVLQRDPSNVTAWLWLAVCMPDRYRRVECLQSALEIQPDNSLIRKALDRMMEEQPSVPPFVKGTMFALMA
ncbi:MAG: hypothetical protein JXA97_09435 [Anaerolineales bacterium]|nr:hypothetical protein [Anaerolineales bacterium]